MDAEKLTYREIFGETREETVARIEAMVALAPALCVGGINRDPMPWWRSPYGR